MLYRTVLIAALGLVLCLSPAHAAQVSLSSCAQALRARVFPKQYGPVAVVLGLNKNGELESFRRAIQRQTGRPAATWFQFPAHHLLNDNPADLFGDKFRRAMREALRRSPGGEPVIYFNLDGIDPSRVWTEHGFTNREIQILFANPALLERTRWFLNGIEIDVITYLQPQHQAMASGY